MIPLARAYLCANCDTVGDRASACPACGSTAVYSLVKMLNHDVPYSGVVRHLIESSVLKGGIS